MHKLKIYLSDTMEEVEIKTIKHALSLAKGNKTKAALSLDISLKTLFNKMKKQNIKREDYLG